MDNLIDSVDNWEQREVLNERYFHNLSWDKIAEKRNYSLRHVYRLRDAGITRIERIITNESDLD